MSGLFELEFGVKAETRTIERFRAALRGVQARRLSTVLSDLDLRKPEDERDFDKGVLLARAYWSLIEGGPTGWVINPLFEHELTEFGVSDFPESMHGRTAPVSDVEAIQTIRLWGDYRTEKAARAALIKARDRIRKLRRNLWESDDPDDRHLLSLLPPEDFRIPDEVRLGQPPSR